jgi:hypothetical protein
MIFLRFFIFSLAIISFADLWALTRLNKTEEPSDNVSLVNFDDVWLLSIAGEYPNYTDSVEQYSSMYDTNRVMPVFKFDKYFGSVFQVGLGFSFGQYQASGKPRKWKEDTKLSSLDEYKEGSEHLSLIPITFYFNSRLFPFGSLIAFGLSVGYREVYIEEVDDSHNFDSREQKPMTKGWNSLLVTRFAVDFRVDGLSENSIASSRKLINLTGIFFVPYFEKTFNLKEDSLWGGRDIYSEKFVSNNIGLSFVFQFG